MPTGGSWILGNWRSQWTSIWSLVKPCSIPPAKNLRQPYDKLKLQPLESPLQTHYCLWAQIFLRETCYSRQCWWNTSPIHFLSHRWKNSVFMNGKTIEILMNARSERPGMLENFIYKGISKLVKRKHSADDCFCLRQYHNFSTEHASYRHE